MIIFKNQHYRAEYYKNRLYIFNQRKEIGQDGYGVVLCPSESSHWSNAIKTGIDNQEKHALCRSLYQNARIL